MRPHPRRTRNALMRFRSCPCRIRWLRLSLFRPSVASGWWGRLAAAPAIRSVLELGDPLGGCHESLAMGGAENSRLGHDPLEGEATCHPQPPLPALRPVLPAAVVDAIR